MSPSRLRGPEGVRAAHQDGGAANAVQTQRRSGVGTNQNLIRNWPPAQRWARPSRAGRPPARLRRRPWWAVTASVPAGPRTEGPARWAVVCRPALSLASSRRRAYKQSVSPFGCRPAAVLTMPGRTCSPACGPRPRGDRAALQRAANAVTAPDSTSAAVALGLLRPAYATRWISCATRVGVVEASPTVCPAGGSRPFWSASED